MSTPKLPEMGTCTQVLELCPWLLPGVAFAAAVLQGRRRLCMVSFSWVFSSLDPLSRSTQFLNKSRLCTVSPCKLLIWPLRPLSCYCSAIPIAVNPCHRSTLIAPVGAGSGLPANRAGSTPAMPNKKRPYKKTPYLQCEVAKTRKKWVTEVAPGKLSRHFWRKCSMHICTRASFTVTWGEVVTFKVVKAVSTWAIPITTWRGSLGLGSRGSLGAWVLRLGMQLGAWDATFVVVAIAMVLR